ncbi:hypothetical protein NDU88_006721 [Pleurodeles waltl]|uniref:Uncharacterized protein n=1 Tax=Pleurodeles waltl TaxID=8319 RepID=A0AAV7MD20_PLEWA|nr:hypothetical protein NDU88_006721 [Pleurodeles waltl]
MASLPARWPSPREALPGLGPNPYISPVRAAVSVYSRLGGPSKVLELPVITAPGPVRAFSSSIAWSREAGPGLRLACGVWGRASGSCQLDSGETCRWGEATGWDVGDSGDRGALLVGPVRQLDRTAAPTAL